MRPIERLIAQEQDKDTQDVLNGYAQAIRTVWNQKGHSPWDQGGVESVELCKTIHEHLEMAQEIQPDRLIEKMLEMTTVYEEFEERSKEIKTFQEEIAEVAEILRQPDHLEDLTIEERKEIRSTKEALLATKKGEYYIKSQKTSTETELCKEIMEDFFKVTNSFGMHLLTYLEVPNMPSTNNETEQFFGRIRTKLRRITGRQNNHSLIYTRGDYISLTINIETYDDIVERISNVSYEDYVAEKNKCQQQNENPKLQRKVRKDSKKFLDSLNLLWKSIQEKVKLV